MLVLISDEEDTNGGQNKQEGMIEGNRGKLSSFFSSQELIIKHNFPLFLSKVLQKKKMQQAAAGGITFSKMMVQNKMRLVDLYF